MLSAPPREWRARPDAFACTSCFFSFTFSCRLSISSRFAYLQYALAGDDHFAVVTCLVRADTPAFIFVFATSDVYRITLAWCPTYISRTAAFALTPPSRTEPLTCARFTTRTALLPSPSSDFFSERHALAVLPFSRTHWVSAGCVSPTSQGYDWANRRPLHGEAISFLYFSYHGLYFSELAPSMMFRQSNV